MTRPAIRCLPLSRDAVRKPEVQVVHFREPHALSAIVGCQPWFMRRDQVLARYVDSHQIDSVVAVDAGLLRMARGAPCRRKARLKLMLSNEVCAVVIQRAQRRQVRVTRFAGVRSLHVVVAGVARGHRGQLHGDPNLRLFNTFVTRLALDLLLLDV